MRLSASPTPTVVVVFPSPAGVGLMAVPVVAGVVWSRPLEAASVEEPLELLGAIGGHRIQVNVCLLLEHVNPPLSPHG